MPRSSAPSSAARSAAVTRLVSPASAAAVSSIPRTTVESTAPAAANARATAGRPTRASTRLVARFDDATIMRSASQPSGAEPPNRRHTRGSLS